MPKLPSRIFVILDPNDEAEPSPDLLAYRNEAEAVQDDGPTEVGVYIFQRAQRLIKKTVVDVPHKKK